MSNVFPRSQHQIRFRIAKQKTLVPIIRTGKFFSSRIISRSGVLSVRYCTSRLDGDELGRAPFFAPGKQINTDGKAEWMLTNKNAAPAPTEKCVKSQLLHKHDASQD